jgi:hypothetical protein
MLLLALPGCMARHAASTPAPKTKKSALKSAPECRPNQYWDGTQCRHKGQGQGARKHDG